MKHDLSVKPLKYLDSFEIQDKAVDSSPLRTPLSLRQTSYRWIALIMMNLVILGDFVALEGPQPIEKQIKDTLKVNEEEYSLLYSSWALPSIFSPLIGGYLTDRFGVRPTMIVFSIAVTVGQFITTMGSYALNFNWMVIGRMIYALGTDPLNVAQIVITNKWFQGKEIGVAMAVSGLTFGIGRGLNSLFTPIIYNITNNLGTPMLFSAVLCLLGTGAAVIMAKWDRKNDEMELQLDSTYLSKVSEHGEQIRMSDIKHFKPIVWMLILYFGLIFGCSFSFNSFTNAFYQDAYGFTNVQAGTIIASNFAVMSISALIFGKIVDKYGKRATMLMYNSFLGVIAFLYFFYATDCDQCFSSVFPQILFGLQLGIAEAAIYPCLPLVLEERYLGTGYGLFFVLENVLVFVLSIVGGGIKDANEASEDKGYFGLLLFFFVWFCCIVYAGFKLLRESNKLSRVLDKQVTKDLDETIIEEGSDLLG